jgi:transposase
LDDEVEDTGRHTGSRTGTRSELVEVVTRGERRRTWSSEQKRLIVVEAMQPGATAAEVIRRWGISSGLFYDWRRQMLAGELGPVPAPVPAFAQVGVAEMGGMEAATPPAPPQQPPQTRERRHPPCRARPAPIEITLPSGAVIRVEESIDGKALRRVLVAVAAAVPR